MYSITLAYGRYRASNVKKPSVLADLSRGETIVRTDFSTLREFFAYAQSHTKPDSYHQVSVCMTGKRWDVWYQFDGVCFVSDPVIAKEQVQWMRQDVQKRFANLSVVGQNRLGGIKDLESLFKGWEEVADRCIKWNSEERISLVPDHLFARIVDFLTPMWLVDLVLWIMSGVEFLVRIRKP